MTNEHIATRLNRLIMDSERVNLTERIKRICGKHCWGCLKPFCSNSHCYCKNCRQLQDDVCYVVHLTSPLTIHPDTDTQ